MCPCVCLVYLCRSQCVGADKRRSSLKIKCFEMAALNFCRCTACPNVVICNTHTHTHGLTLSLTQGIANGRLQKTACWYKTDVEWICSSQGVWYSPTRIALKKEGGGGKICCGHTIYVYMYIILQQRLDETDDLTPSLSQTQIHTKHTLETSISNIWCIKLKYNWFMNNHEHHARPTNL